MVGTKNPFATNENHWTITSKIHSEPFLKTVKSRTMMNLLHSGWGLCWGLENIFWQSIVASDCIYGSRPS